MTRNRCSPITLVLSHALGEYLIFETKAQATTSAGPVSSHESASVRSLQPAISALFHVYHRDPQRLRKLLEKYRLEGVSADDVLPGMGVPPFLVPPGFNAAKDLPTFDFGGDSSLLKAIQRKLGSTLSEEALRRYDLAFDAVTALANWVEKKQPPDTLLGSHMTNGVADLTRPLCPYPAVAQYSGQGDVKDAASFSCRLPR